MLKNFLLLNRFDYPAFVILVGHFWPKSFFSSNEGINKVKRSLQIFKEILEEVKNHMPNMQIVLVPSLEDFGLKTYPK